MNLRTSTKPFIRSLLLATTVMASGTVLAGPLTLSTVPLDVQEGVPPNILLTMDDSGSMAWSFIPDSIGGNYALNAAKSSYYNKIYYNPNTVYSPPVDKDGKPFANASFSSAWFNGFDHGAGTVDLSSAYRPTWGYPGYSSSYCSWGASYCSYTDMSAPAPQRAFYYTYNGSGSVTVDSNYTKHVVGQSSDITPGTQAQQEQNFANWYSYYRTRTLMARTSAGKAFASVDYATRVSYQALNSSTTIGTFKPFEGTTRSNFFNWLYSLPASGGTPLRSAFVRAGKAYSTSGINSPYAKDPGVNGTPEYSCRQNFLFAFTDGMWNGNMPSSPTIGNYDDNTHDPLPETVLGVSKYTPHAPYEDGNSNYLADIAMYYWAKDLRTDLTNNVSPYIKDANAVDFNGDGTISDSEKYWSPKNDPATWQHMVTYTIGLGVAGLLSYPSDYNDLLLGNKSWPVGASNGNGLEQVDDLWHAGINGRGDYFNASDPKQLVAAFQAALNNQSARSGSGTGPATSLPVYAAGTLLYQPFYDTGDWSGNIVAQDIVTLAQVWDAQTRLDAQIKGLSSAPARNLITLDPLTKTGIPFQWSSLSAGLKNDLNKDSSGTVDNLGDKRVDYLRGNDTYELKNGGTFRNRQNALGDIVNSTPLYVGNPDRVYPDSLESSPYSAFLSTYANRKPVIYVGANDGQLHAFDAANGNELFAYAPAVLFPQLSKLTDPLYQHRFYVDGPPSEGDAYFSNSWHTVLVGGLGAGGQGIYALDITDPSNFSESNAANMALWEFTDADDADLGDTFSQPQIVKMNNGKWVAVFGNGYNNTVADGHASSTGDAVLYVVDISNGKLIAKLDTGVGSSSDPSGLNHPNGLSTVTPVDINGDYKVDYLYAGDLFGNLWKFNVTDTNPTKWFVAGKGSTPTPLFTATDSSGNAQPITSKPVVNFHPSQGGLLIGFGTGKYIAITDLSDTSQQSMYVVWDRMESNVTTINRSVLKQQKVLSVSSQFNPVLARVTSDYSFDWYLGSGLPSTSSNTYLGWYFNLPDPGERQIYDPILRGGRLIFNSVVPNQDPCQAGGYSWLNELDFATGKRLGFSPFDYNGDGVFDNNDLVKVNFDVNGDGKVDSKDVVPGSSLRNTKLSKTGNYKVLVDRCTGSACKCTGPQCEMKVSTTTTGQVVKVREQSDAKTLGRRSWYQFNFD